MNKLLIAALAVVSIFAVAVLGVLVYVTTSGEDEPTSEPEQAEREPTPIEQAASKCLSKDDTMRVGDDYGSLIIDTKSEWGSFKGLNCALGVLGTSDVIRSQMDATTSMMGVQTAEQDGLTYSWSYHPDNGVNMTITAAS